MRIDLTGDHGLFAQRVVFDPFTLTAASLASTAIGTATAAAGTIAGGNYAKTAGEMQKAAHEYRAKQLDMNASQALASGQRKMFDAQDRTRRLISTTQARAAASGFDPGAGDIVDTVGDIAGRGSYHALMEMFNGESAATGMVNQAKGERFSGEMAEIEGEAKRKASYLAAAGTIAGGAGSMMSTYGKFQYPTHRGAAGANL